MNRFPRSVWSFPQERISVSPQSSCWWATQHRGANQPQCGTTLTCSGTQRPEGRPMWHGNWWKNTTKIQQIKSLVHLTQSFLESNSLEFGVRISHGIVFCCCIQVFSWWNIPHQIKQHLVRKASVKHDFKSFLSSSYLDSKACLRCCRWICPFLTTIFRAGICGGPYFILKYTTSNHWAFSKLG